MVVIAMVTGFRHLTDICILLLVCPINSWVITTVTPNGLTSHNFGTRRTNPQPWKIIPQSFSGFPKRNTPRDTKAQAAAQSGGYEQLLSPEEQANNENITNLFPELAEAWRSFGNVLYVLLFARVLQDVHRRKYTREGSSTLGDA